MIPSRSRSRTLRHAVGAGLVGLLAVMGRGCGRVASIVDDVARMGRPGSQFADDAARFETRSSVTDDLFRIEGASMGDDAVRSSRIAPEQESTAEALAREFAPDVAELAIEQLVENYTPHTGYEDAFPLHDGQPERIGVPPLLDSSRLSNGALPRKFRVITADGRPLSTLKLDEMQKLAAERKLKLYDLETREVISGVPVIVIPKSSDDGAQ